MTDQYYGGHTAIPRATEACSGAPASADLIRSHASRAHWMAEWTFGERIVGVTPCAPIPAHSVDPGHDHSGGIMGVPIVRPLWTQSFGYPDAALTTALVNNGRAPSATLTSSAASGQRAYVYAPGALRNVKIPGCPKDSVAHRRGVVILEVYASHAFTLYVQVQDFRITYSTVLTAAAFNDVEFPYPISLIPGENQDIPLQAWIQGATGGVTWVASLCSVSINQTLSTP